MKTETYARNIDAWDINARNIDAGNINAGDIDAYFIICEKVTQKEDSKLIAKHVITERSEYKQKEQRV